MGLLWIPVFTGMTRKRAKGTGGGAKMAVEKCERSWQQKKASAAGSGKVRG